MNSPIKTRALARANHERRLLAIIEEHLAEMTPEEREARVAAALTLGMWDELDANKATVTPMAKIKPESWRTAQAKRTSVTAEKRYGRKK